MALKFEIELDDEDIENMIAQYNAVSIVKITRADFNKRSEDIVAELMGLSYMVLDDITQGENPEDTYEFLATVFEPDHLAHYRWDREDLTALENLEIEDLDPRKAH